MRFAPGVSARLVVALAAAVLSHVLISLAALARTGEWNWFADVGRPAILALLAILVVQGRGWARWVLIVWLSLSALAFLAGLFTAGATGAGFLMMIVFGLMTALFVWVILELVKADLVGPSTKSV